MKMCHFCNYHFAKQFIYFEYTENANSLFMSMDTMDDGIEITHVLVFHRI